MGIERLYVAKELSETLIITSGYTGNSGCCPIVRPDFDMVHVPVLWKRGNEYRIFSAELLDKIYQVARLGETKQSAVAMFWRQGVVVDPKVGKILW